MSDAPAAWPTHEQRMAMNQACQHVITREVADAAVAAISEGFCPTCRIGLTVTEHRPYCGCCGFAWNVLNAESIARVFVRDGPLRITRRTTVDYRGISKQGILEKVKP